MFSPGFCHPALTYCCSLLTAPPHHGAAGQLLHFPGATYGGSSSASSAAFPPQARALQHWFLGLILCLSTLRSKVVSPEAQGWRALLLTDLSVQSGYKMWFPFQALTLLTLGKVCWPCAGCRQTLLSVFLLPDIPPRQ